MVVGTAIAGCSGGRYGAMEVVEHILLDASQSDNQKKYQCDCLFCWFHSGAKIACLLLGWMGLAEKSDKKVRLELHASMLRYGEVADMVGLDGD